MRIAPLSPLGSNGHLAGAGPRAPALRGRAAAQRGLRCARRGRARASAALCAGMRRRRRRVCVVCDGLPSPSGSHAKGFGSHDHESPPVRPSLLPSSTVRPPAVATPLRHEPERAALEPSARERVRVGEAPSIERLSRSKSRRSKRGMSPIERRGARRRRDATPPRLCLIASPRDGRGSSSPPRRPAATAR